MDIEFLLILQSFRECTESYLAPFMDWATKMAVSFFPVAIMLMIYWVFDRKSGRRMLCGMALGFLVNGLLKLIVCAYRPWIRDARVEPYGDSKVSATGYSFPSGHATNATIYYGSVGYWFRNKKRIVTIVLYVMILITMFSRNYLGVHTPQDVIVGFGATALMLVVGCIIENWSDKDSEKRDKIVLWGGLIICALCVAFYNLKSYPMDYLPDGTLLVNPNDMMLNSYEGIGFVAAYVVCRYFERRGFDFDIEICWKDRFIIGTIALIPLMWWFNHIEGIFKAVNMAAVGKIVWGAGIVVYSTIIVPIAMKKIRIPK